MYKLITNKIIDLKYGLLLNTDEEVKKLLK